MASTTSVHHQQSLRTQADIQTPSASAVSPSASSTAQETIAATPRINPRSNSTCLIGRTSAATQLPASLHPIPFNQALLPTRFSSDAGQQIRVQEPDPLVLPPLLPLPNDVQGASIFHALSPHSVQTLATLIASYLPRTSSQSERISPAQQQQPSLLNSVINLLTAEGYAEPSPALSPFV